MLHKTIEIRNLSDSTYVLRLERNGFSFKPGQCVNLGLKGSGVNREYSTYSGIDEPYLEFIIKEIRGGTVSPGLRQVKPGTEVELHGPYGSFVIEPAQAKATRFVFIGTGTGIAPFHSFTRSYPDLDYQIINGIRDASEQFDTQDYDPDRLVCCVSREKWDGFNGRVTDYLKQTEITQDKVYYLCGNQGMIYDVYDILRNAGVSGDQIFTEAFF